MIDISQIVSSAANAANASDANRRAAADAAAGGFGDALTRARDSSKPQTPAPAAKDTAAARDKAAASGNKQPAAQPAHADAGKQQAASTGKPRTADHEDKDEDDATAAAPTDAAAAAALALLLPAAAPATPAPAPAGAAAAAVGGVGDAGSSAALQAALAGATPAGSATAPDSRADAKPAAATTLADTLQVVTAEAKPAQPSVADTLATIASQRAAMQGNAPAGADGKAAAVAPQAVAGAALGAQQDTPGQSGNQRPDSGIGQHRADPLAASAVTTDAKPAASFAAAQATARASEAAASTDNAPTLVATLAAQQTPSASAAALAAASRPVVAPPLYDSQWPQALGQQMIRLSTQGQQSAELQLNPPDLGPLKVVLNVVNDQAQAQFVSPHQAVRAAVEAALPHLRTALSENGIQLGQTSVGSDGFASQAGNGQQQQSPGNGRGQGGFGAGTLAAAEPAAAPATATVRPARMLGRGEIDTFA
ncbi:flagellar hook-length control protein FliK [Cupriavidus necator]|uniref:flagellar hook-length control protein FliK n=1 Tax=Cupriavidus necator TaxID=106590 RepID=UPI0039C1B8A7